MGVPFSLPHEHRWTVEVAGWSIHVASEEQGLQLEPVGATRAFCVERVDADLEMWVSRENRSVPQDARLTFDSGGVWRSFETATHHWLEMRSSLFHQGPYEVASIKKHGTRVELFIHPDYVQARSIDPLEYPLDELLFLRLATAGGGLELHAAGVDAGERGGWILLAHSGGGKSTAARLIAEAGVGTILSDDRIVLRHREGRWWMYGTPWHGTARFAAPRGCPLTRLYLLSHAGENQLSSLAPSAMAAEIAARTFSPLYAPHLLAPSLAAVQRLVSEIRCQRLAFSPQPPVACFLATDNDSFRPTDSPI